ncbi:hypothetical protein CVIRNUC_002559 [Coccomyxa viridis]|uniref:Pentatricopeptide repeat-containing protein n=1 Tax=Coccomyxa viridis TaxID=1274662 RepID=A0AAV1HX71_9CHLO|nr:hypothetical protein CVIRNUC_002559 [Coccomyxa viridis]
MHQRFYTGKASSLGLLLAVGGSTSQRWKRSPRVLVIKQRRGQQQHSHSCASRTDLAAELQQCDSSDDWVKAVEIFAEARALKEDISPEAVEAGVRVFARHGQHERSVELLRGAVGKAAVSVETLQAVFTALLQANEPALAMDLLQEIDWDMHGDEAKAAAFNSVARTCARGGMLDEGLSLLERMQASSIDVGRATFDSLALGCLKLGRGEEAEQLFDERDYL